ncbi:MAG: hypothetical protein JXL97_20235, partial [Bacteroidales bacterium]|nr:hypothetical protein [Bacteroidales bacterium]
MRRVFLFLILILGFASAFSQNSKTLLSSNENETIIKFSLNDYSFKTVQTPNGEELVINAPETANLLLAGSPDLLKMTASVIIPDKGGSKVEIITGEYEEFSNISIAPSKGNLTRDINPNDVPYTYGKPYLKDEFFPGKLTNIESPYIMRDYRGQAVHVYPFQYNPVSKTLRVYSEITVKVTYTTEAGINELVRTRNFDKVDFEFNQVYKNHFINYEQANSRYTPVEEEGNMLIICYDDFMDEMADFVTWKNTIGRPTEMVAISTIGNNSTSIKNYVTDYYNSNGLTYLLLIGDAAQITPITSGLGGDSDNGYAYISGSDHYLEFFVGRFSAENAGHVTTQVERSLAYEDGSTLTDGWLNRTAGIASNDGSGGDDNEMDWEHYRNMATDLLNFTYSQTLEFFDGSQGGFDAAGNPTATIVGNEINNGIGIINYTGHGSETSWVTSGFDIDDINGLTNNNKLPFIFDVACVNGDFNGNTCFGEAWLRATNSSEPTGAIAIVASTINQSWNPPMNAQDEMVDLLVGTSANGIKRTFTGIAVNGMFLMNDEDADFAMTDTWTTFGDPSLMVRTDDPADMTITHDAVILFGSSDFTINCNFNDAFACISKAGEIIGTAYVSGGQAIVPLAGSFNPGDELTIAVTGFNKVTYLANVTVVAPTGPYDILESYTINDGGNNQAEFGETFNLDVTVKNVGANVSENATVTITTSDVYVNSFTNASDVDFGDIAADDSHTSSGKFTVTLANNVPDQHVVSFNVVITDDATTKTIYNSNINLVVNAPALTIGNLTIDDSALGNGDGILDPGE